MKTFRTWLLVGLLGLVACASEPPPPAAPPTPVLRPSPLPLSPKPVPVAEDQCRAGAVMGLIGRSRLEIPVPVLPALQRVACTTCPVTRDYNPRRLNFFFDAETGLIKDVRCG